MCSLPLSFYYNSSSNKISPTSHSYKTTKQKTSNYIPGPQLGSRFGESFASTSTLILSSSFSKRAQNTFMYNHKVKNNSTNLVIHSNSLFQFHNLFMVTQCVQDKASVFGILTFVILFRMMMGLIQSSLHDLDLSEAKVTVRFVK